MNFWRAFVVTIRNNRYLSLIIAGDVFIWNPNFTLSRDYSCEFSFIAFIDLKMISYRLTLSSLRDRAFRTNDTEIDLIFLSRIFVVNLVWWRTISSDISLLMIMNTDHLLRIDKNISFSRSSDEKNRVTSHTDLVWWSVQIQIFNDSNRFSSIDVLFSTMITNLHRQISYNDESVVERIQ